MPMLLAGENGAEFELSLIEDRFPEVQDGDRDSAWVTIQFRVGTAGDSLEETSPCLNVFELQNLAEWLEAVGGHRPEAGEVDLLQPELNFSVAREQGEDVTVRVRFHLEDRPEQMGVDASTERDYLDLRIGRDQARTAAAALRRDLETIVAHSGGGAGAREEASGMMGEPDEELGLAPPGVTRGLDEDDDERVF